MLDNNIIFKCNEDDKLPKWFYEWFIIMENLQNKTFHEVEAILEKGDFFWATLFFEEQTLYNPNKTWH